MIPVSRATRPTPGALHRSAILGVAALGLVAAPLGCNNDEGFTSLSPEVEFDPAPGTTLEFDTVTLDRTTAEPIIVTVRNVGDGPLSVLDVSVDGDDSGAIFVSTFPEQVNAGESGEIWLRFEPTTPESFSATLVVETNDLDESEVSFPIAGVAKDPCALQIAPPHSNFLLGEIKEVTIENTSASDCRVTNILTDRRMFDFMADPELPIDIPANATHTLEVQHVRGATSPGVPVREIRVKESQGTEAVGTFSGEPPVFGCFSVFPNNINFPRTSVAQQVQRRVTVENSCARDAAVTSVVVGNGFYYYSVDRDAYPTVVPANSSVDVWVTYTPFSPLGDIGRLVINTNDAANPRFEIDLYGEAAVPLVEIFPASLDFGTVVFRNPSGPTNRSECASRTQVVQVYSTGEADVVIDSLEILGDGDDEFLITGVLLDGQPVADFTQPMVVQPGQEMRISVVFYPTRSDPQPHRSTLRINHNSGTRVDEIALLGDGAADGAVTDVFDQLEGPKVDILWVIDNSCSMYDEQARLISNMEQFVGYADSQNADYQMAVTDTDSRSSNAGKFERCFPHPAVISSSYGDDTEDPTGLREAAFRCTFDVGTNGSGYEAGLGAAKAALERAISPTLDPATNVNRGFVRPDAKLAIVTMSDEEDQSEESDDVLRDYFFSVKGSHRPDRVAVHAIAGPVAENCERDSRFPPQPGYRYFNMTRETGGIFFNICLDDWSPVLNQLGLDVFTPTDEWDLSQAADPGTIVVEVDGVPIQPDPQNGWTYSPASNSVRFNGASVPEPGSQIVIDYSGLCRP